MFMQVYVSTLEIEGALIEGVNPLPMFRNREHHRQVPDNGTLAPAYRHLIGYETGERMLPYLMQDRYTRARKTLTLKTVVLENDVLKAVFLPEYGGRLYSLVDKCTGEEILYRNPVFQPGNLAILNAWFSGGAEWNIGQVGHTFTTSSPVHAAKLTDDEGNEFLRIYEYERCKNVFWHIDFHLPQGAKELQIYVRIVNDRSDAVPMYWWTNIAVQETPQARVFSTTSEVIYIDHQVKGFGLGQLPNLPTVPDEDVSYPIKFPFSNEYFFQTPAAFQSPWEAVAYEDGRLFYERSTARLRYRKMFCWGHHAGGRRWCDFLAKPGEGNYIEIQAGFAPTQLHGLDMPAHTEWDFTQMMGMSYGVESAQVYAANWSEANRAVADYVEQLLPEEQVQETHQRLAAYAERLPAEILCYGSGWGTLERIRREHSGEVAIPAGFVFADEALTSAQSPWLTLLHEGQLPVPAVHDVPASWMVQREWRELVQASLQVDLRGHQQEYKQQQQHRQEQQQQQEQQHPSWYGLLHYGVMLYEAGDEEQAVAAWKASIDAEPSVWAYRNLAVAAKQMAAMEQMGDKEQAEEEQQVEAMRQAEEKRQAAALEQALQYMEAAYELARAFPDPAFAEEYLALLVQKGDHARAWEVFSNLPKSFSESDRLQIIVGEAALALNKLDFLQQLFTTEFAVIREGEVTIVELWYKLHVKRIADERGVPLSDDLLQEARALYPPPSNIDFRIIGS